MNEEEKRTVSIMIAIYCKAKHQKGGLCDTCSELEKYAHHRLEKCPFGEGKPTCENCKVHCYKKDKRALVQQAMRYAGPRMLFKHPILAIKHLLKNRKAPQ